MELISEIDLDLNLNPSASEISTVLSLCSKGTTFSSVENEDYSTCRAKNKKLTRQRLSLTQIPQSIHLFQYDSTKNMEKTEGRSSLNSRLQIGSVLPGFQMNILLEDDTMEIEDDFEWDDDEEDAIFMQILSKSKNQVPTGSQDMEKEKVKPLLKKLIITTTEDSIILNGKTRIKLPFKIRSSCVLKGSCTTDRSQDILVVSLPNGCLLLLELVIDSSIMDHEDFNLRQESFDLTPPPLKFFITQYYKPQLRGIRQDTEPLYDSMGYQLKLHKSGRVLMNSALYETIRLHPVNFICETQSKRYISTGTDITTDGKILHSLFHSPTPDLDYVVMFIQTNERRLVLRAIQFEIQNEEEEHSVKLLSMTQTLISKTNTLSRIPIHMTELSGKLLLIYESELILISVNQIISCDLSHPQNLQRVIIEDLGFTVSFYKPESGIMARNKQEDLDEILLVNETGKLFSVIYQSNGELRWSCIKKCGNKEIVGFIMEKEAVQQNYGLFADEFDEDDMDIDQKEEKNKPDQEYTVTFYSVSTSGSTTIEKYNTSIQLSSLDNNKKSQNKPEVLLNTTSICPLNSLITIPSSTEDEIWVTHSRGISRLTKGIGPLTSELKLRISPETQVTALYVHYAESSDLFFVVLSSINGSMAYSFSENTNDLIELEIGEDENFSGTFMTRDRTVFMTSFQNWVFQITEAAIIVCDPCSPEIGSLIYDFRGNESHSTVVIIGDAFQDYIAVITEETQNLSTALRWFRATDDIRPYGEIVDLFFDKRNVSCLKFVLLENSLFLLVSYDNKIDIYRDSCNKDSEPDQIIVDGPEFLATVDLKFSNNIDSIHDMVAHDNVLYVTSRYGELLIYSVKSNEFELQFIKSSKVDTSPLTLSLCSSSHIIIQAHQDIYHLPFFNNSSSCKPIRIIPNFEKTQECKLQIIAASQISMTKYMILTPHYLTIQQFPPLSTNPNIEQLHPTVTLKDTAIQQFSTPTKLKYLPTYQLLFVTNLNDQSITVINPSKARIIPCVIQTNHKRNIFKSDERITNITEWAVKISTDKDNISSSERKTYETYKRCLLMGTHLSKSGKGSIKLVSLKKGQAAENNNNNKETIILTILETIPSQCQISSIHAIPSSENAQFISWFIVSGGMINLLSYNLNKKKFSELKILHEFGKMISDFKIIKNKICVTILGSGIRLFQFDVFEANDEDIVRVLLTENVRIPDDLLPYKYTQTVPLTNGYFLINDNMAQSIYIVNEQGVVLEEMTRLGYSPIIVEGSSEPNKVVMYGQNGQIDLFEYSDVGGRNLDNTNEKNETLKFIKDYEISEIGNWSL